MADLETAQPATTTDSDVMYVWKFPIDKTYVKSYTGILKVVAAVISLIAFICVASGRSDNCDDKYSSTYNYFEFVSISAFFTLLIFWLLYALTLHTKLFLKNIPWVFVDLVYCAVYILFYFIANCVLAAQSCGKDSNKAGCAFGFFALFAFGGNAFFAFQEWRGTRQKPAEAAAPQSPDYNADKNMELY